MDLYVYIYMGPWTDFDFRVQEMCESRGGRPGLPSLIILTVSVDVKQHFNNFDLGAQELRESRGGRPGLLSLINLRFLWT